MRPKIISGLQKNDKHVPKSLKKECQLIIMFIIFKTNYIKWLSLTNFILNIIETYFSPLKNLLLIYEQNKINE